MKAILGKKIEMSQIFDDQNKVIPVTLIEAGPCKVLRIKTQESDGYEAIQIEYGKKKKEFHGVEGVKVGDIIDVTVFKEGEKVKVSGVSKGKGFQGVVKRHGFHGKNASHGTKHQERTIGSVGSTGPQRVFKGKKMPGHMGAERVSIKNVKVIKVDKDSNIIVLKGAIPGRRGTLLEIRG